jgi:hypothetical protein
VLFELLLLLFFVVCLAFSHFYFVDCLRFIHDCCGASVYFIFAIFPGLASSPLSLTRLGH